MAKDNMLATAICSQIVKKDPSAEKPETLVPNAAALAECTDIVEPILADNGRAFCKDADNATGDAIVSCFVKEEEKWTGMDSGLGIRRVTKWKLGVSDNGILFQPNLKQIRLVMGEAFDKATSAKFVDVYTRSVAEATKSIDTPAVSFTSATPLEKVPPFVKYTKVSDTEHKYEMPALKAESLTEAISLDLFLAFAANGGKGTEFNGGNVARIRLSQDEPADAAKKFTLALEYVVARTTEALLWIKEKNAATAASVDAAVEELKKIKRRAKDADPEEFLDKEANKLDSKKMTVKLTEEIVKQCGDYYTAISRQARGIPTDALLDATYGEKQDKKVGDSLFYKGGDPETVKDTEEAAVAFLAKLRELATEKGLVLPDADAKKSDWSFEGALGVELSNGEADGASVAPSLEAGLKYKFSNVVSVSGSTAVLNVNNPGVLYRSELPYQPDGEKSSGSLLLLLGGQGKITFVFDKDEEKENRATINIAGGIVSTRIRNANVAADRDHQRDVDLYHAASRALGGLANFSYVVYKGKDKDGKVVKDKDGKSAELLTFTAEFTGGKKYNPVMGEGFGAVPGEVVGGNGSIKWSDANCQASDSLCVDSMGAQAGYYSSLGAAAGKYSMGLNAYIKIWITDWLYAAAEAYASKTNQGVRGGAYGAIGGNWKNVISEAEGENLDFIIRAGGNGSSPSNEVGTADDSSFQVTDGTGFTTADTGYDQAAWDVLGMLTYSLPLGPVTFEPYLFLGIGDASYGGLKNLNGNGGAGLGLKW